MAQVGGRAACAIGARDARARAADVIGAARGAVGDCRPGIVADRLPGAARCGAGVARIGWRGALCHRCTRCTSPRCRRDWRRTRCRRDRRPGVVADRLAGAARCAVSQGLLGAQLAPSSHVAVLEVVVVGLVVVALVVPVPPVPVALVVLVVLGLEVVVVLPLPPACSEPVEVLPPLPPPQAGTAASITNVAPASTPDCPQPSSIASCTSRKPFRLPSSSPPPHRPPTCPHAHASVRVPKSTSGTIRTRFGSQLTGNPKVNARRSTRPPRLGPALHLGLVEHRRHVKLHCPLRDAEHRRDRACGAPLHEQLQYLALPCGERERPFHRMRAVPARMSIRMSALDCMAPRPRPRPSSSVFVLVFNARARARSEEQVERERERVDEGRQRTKAIRTLSVSKTRGARYEYTFLRGLPF